MRISPEDLAADLNELNERVMLAYQRLMQAQFELAVASQVYDALAKAHKDLACLAELRQRLPNLENEARNRVTASQSIDF